MNHKQHNRKNIEIQKEFRLDVKVNVERHGFQNQDKRK